MSFAELPRFVQQVIERATYCRCCARGEVPEREWLCIVSYRCRRRRRSNQTGSCRNSSHLLRTSFASFGAGQQSVNVQFALSSDIDFAVHDEWNHKPHCQAGAISGDILLAAVKFMRYVCRIES